VQTSRRPGRGFSSLLMDSQLVDGDVGLPNVALRGLLVWTGLVWPMMDS
jgi:hypothetical protein